MLVQLIMSYVCMFVLLISVDRLVERALQHFENALHSIGDDPSILALAATAARKLRDFPKALRYLHRALDISPTDLECHLQVFS